MKQYLHHIGDFNHATRHLTRIERSVYRDLLDMYYDTESPIPLDLALVCRKIIARSNEESTAVEQVLNEFFTETQRGWYHARCEDEIEAYRANSSQKAMAGRASAEAKRQKKIKKLLELKQPQTDVETNAIIRSALVQQPLNSVETEHQRNSTNHKPITNNQEPTDKRHVATGDQSPPSVEQIATAHSESAPQQKSKALPDCRYTELIDLYHDVLPELPRAKVMSEPRKAAMRKRWLWVLQTTKPDGTRRARDAPEALAWFRDFFTRAGQNDFIMGRTGRTGPHSAWEADVDYLMSDKGLKQVVEKTKILDSTT